MEAIQKVYPDVFNNKSVTDIPRNSIASEMVRNAIEQFNCRKEMEQMPVPDSDSDDGISAEEKAEYKWLLQISQKLKFEEDKLHELHQLQKAKEHKFKQMKLALASTSVHLTRSMTKVRKNVMFNLAKVLSDSNPSDGETVIMEYTHRKSMSDSPDEDNDIKDTRTSQFPSEKLNDISSDNESDREKDIPQSIPHKMSLRSTSMKGRITTTK